MSGVQEDPEGHAQRMTALKIQEEAATQAVKVHKSILSELAEVRERLASERQSFLELKEATDKEHAETKSRLSAREAAVKDREDAASLKEQWK